MALVTNNIGLGNNIVIANANGTMDIFSSIDTTVVRSVVNGNYISYQPGRSINSLTSIQAGKGYIVTSKAVRNLPIFDLATSDMPVFTSTINNLR